jgi:hypothetical protein
MILKRKMILTGNDRQNYTECKPIIAGDGHTGPQQDVGLWHGSQQGLGGQHGNGGQHFGGQIGGLTTKAIFLQQASKTRWKRYVKV